MFLACYLKAPYEKLGVISPKKSLGRIHRSVLCTIVVAILTMTHLDFSYGEVVVIAVIITISAVIAICVSLLIKRELI